MSKANYIPWSSWEEQALPEWIAHNGHLSWEKKSEKYRRVFGLPRGPESLRGKYNQLLKGIHRHRSISGNMPRRRRRHAMTPPRQRPLQSPAKHFRPSDSPNVPALPSRREINPKPTPIM
ncbi:hypothetical protein N7509_000083 [Penicillium cosmopolitanum]|uniref:Myb-like domain-containing protein n=1 Tax=Penicillium cosmopolitanum TaxID=1131564 RepID=A0A9W9WCH5_9EURO|nr:uncharacterized protein N7509_000083 [Penicillium cosmopolitanum]KAJ5414985.1 hypothetical protein N7509_000083 [Penicillium cosmopolitanum]